MNRSTEDILKELEQIEKGESDYINPILSAVMFIVLILIMWRLF